MLGSHPGCRLVPPSLAWGVGRSGASAAWTRSCPESAAAAPEPNTQDQSIKNQSNHRYHTGEEDGERTWKQNTASSDQRGTRSDGLGRRQFTMHPPKNKPTGPEGKSRKDQVNEPANKADKISTEKWSAAVFDVCSCQTSSDPRHVSTGSCSPNKRRKNGKNLNRTMSAVLPLCGENRA